MKASRYVKAFEAEVRIKCATTFKISDQTEILIRKIKIIDKFFVKATCCKNQQIIFHILYTNSNRSQELYSLLNSCMTTLKKMMLYIQQVDKWERTLSLILEVTEMILTVQRQWMYLEVFHSKFLQTSHSIRITAFIMETYQLTLILTFGFNRIFSLVKTFANSSQESRQSLMMLMLTGRYIVQHSPLIRVFQGCLCPQPIFCLAYCR